MSKPFCVSGPEYITDLFLCLFCCRLVKSSRVSQIQILKANEERVTKALDIIPLIKTLRNVKFFMSAFLTDKQMTLLKFQRLNLLAN